MFMMTRFTAAFIAAFIFSASASADIELIEGPAHEAYLAPVLDSTVLEAVTLQPPGLIKENTPLQQDQRTVWIPGYWAWDKVRKDFIWIGGVWRRPPPGRQWVPGQWKETEAGWVYVRGFWSDQPAASLEYVKQTPPDALEEKVTDSPGPEYFWAAGHWQYIPATQKYSWLKGRWEKFDQNWVLVPAHYVWRPEGYVLVNSYWDWTIREMGSSYAGLWIPPDKRAAYEYNPIVVVDPLFIVRRNFFYYPNYTYFYNHHYHYSVEFWNGFSFSPPWWGWQQWWSLTWKDQWALWWWWSNPGYPAPEWLDANVAAQMTGPKKDLAELMKDVFPPLNITPKGIVSTESLILSINKSLPQLNAPVLPAKEDLSKTIITDATKGLKALDGKLRPSAKTTTLVNPLPKPEFVVEQISRVINSAAVPAKPTLFNQGAEGFKVPTAPRENIRQWTYPSERPNLEMPSTAPMPSNVYKPQMPEAAPSMQRQKFQGPEYIQSTTPYSEQRKIYRSSESYYSPSAPSYSPPSIDGSRYTPAFQNEEMFAPPSSASYQPRESLRTTSPENYFTPVENTNPAVQENIEQSPDRSRADELHQMPK